MRENYKRLGDYIEQVNIRNRDLKDIPLMGLSIEKVFIPSIANTIGTNMANYKVIMKNQFAYGPVTSRNGDKITIALFKDYEEALISQAYIPFEIVKTDELLPDYLMMWFSRPEFDRYARYKSHGSARETFDWSEMCDVYLPVPSIEKQEEIVAEYQAIENKIKVNEQICQKLEATAQAIYKEWFVEFNFPNKEGKPYKDNGGKMVWNDELDKEVPEGWEVGGLSDIANYRNGLAMQRFRPKNERKSLGVLKIRELNVGNIDTNSDRCDINIPENVKVYNGDIIFSWSGTLKVDIWAGENAGLNQHLFKVTSTKFPKWFFYYATKLHLEDFIRLADARKTSMGHIKRENLKQAKIAFSSSGIHKNIDYKKTNNLEYILNAKTQNQKLTELKSLLLTRMVK